LEVVFLVQLPCPLGRGFRKANYLFIRALALYFSKIFPILFFLSAIQPCQPFEGWQG